MVIHTVVGIKKSMAFDSLATLEDIKETVGTVVITRSNSQD